MSSIRIELVIGPDTEWDYGREVYLHGTSMERLDGLIREVRIACDRAVAFLEQEKTRG